MSDKKDDLGDRMKGYEKVQTAICLKDSLPKYARLDGRGFSKFTKDMKRPFDETMSNCMVETTKYLMKETHAIAAYTQSDEISLLWDSAKEENSGSFFEGKLQKLASVLASMATAKFMSQLPIDLAAKLPHFDCRILNVPDQMEAANMIVWRDIDARKNAISMLARCHFSHKDLQGQNGKQMLSMLAEKNIFMQDYPSAFRNGVFLRREKISKKLTEEDKIFMKIPDHIFRNMNMSVVRNEYKEVNISPFTNVTNKVDVVFNGKEVEFEFDRN